MNATIFVFTSLCIGPFVCGYKSSEVQPRGGNGGGGGGGGGYLPATGVVQQHRGPLGKQFFFRSTQTGEWMKFVSTVVLKTSRQHDHSSNREIQTFSNTGSFGDRTAVKLERDFAQWNIPISIDTKDVRDNVGQHVVLHRVRQSFFKASFSVKSVYRYSVISLGHISLVGSCLLVTSGVPKSFKTVFVHEKVVMATSKQCCNVRNQTSFLVFPCDFHKSGAKWTGSDSRSVTPKKHQGNDTESASAQRNKTMDYPIVLDKLLADSELQMHFWRWRRKRDVTPAPVQDRLSADDPGTTATVSQNFSSWRNGKPLSKAQLQQLIDQLRADRTREPLWAMLSVVIIMVVLFWAVWACGMKRIDRSREIHVDVDEDFHFVSVREVLKSKRRFLPRNIFKKRPKKARYTRLRDIDLTDPVSDNSDEERILYDRGFNDF